MMYTNFSKIIKQKKTKKGKFKMIKLSNVIVDTVRERERERERESYTLINKESAALFDSLTHTGKI